LAGHVTRFILAPHLWRQQAGVNLKSFCRLPGGYPVPLGQSNLESSEQASKAPSSAIMTEDNSSDTINERAMDAPDRRGFNGILAGRETCISRTTRRESSSSMKMKFSARRC
jgi:hypothetical protein